jgi:hypothetical protein
VSERDGRHEPSGTDEDASRAVGLFSRSPLLVLGSFVLGALALLFFVGVTGPFGLLFLLVVGGLLVFRWWWRRKLDTGGRDGR